MSEQREMESGTLAKLGEALAKAQGAMESAAKDATNPHFRSRYADLASIREAIRKPLSDNGLCFFQRATTAQTGVSVETTLLHISGEFVRDVCWLPVAQQTPQAYGSAITYARRYSLSTLVGVVADEDDDGNAASAATHQPAQGAGQQGRSPPPPPAKTKTAPPPEPRALKVERVPDPIRCAEGGHEWDLKGKCSNCGAAEPKAPKQHPALRARAVKVWTSAQKAGLTQEAFQDWTAQVIGRKAPSSDWETHDVDLLEVAAQEFTSPQRQPGEEG